MEITAIPLIDNVVLFNNIGKSIIAIHNHTNGRGTFKGWVKLTSFQISILDDNKYPFLVVYPLNQSNVNELVNIGVIDGNIDRIIPLKDIVGINPPITYEPSTQEPGLRNTTNTVTKFIINGNNQVIGVVGAQSIYHPNRLLSPLRFGYRNDWMYSEERDEAVALGFTVPERFRIVNEPETFELRLPGDNRRLPDLFPDGPPRLPEIPEIPEGLLEYQRPLLQSTLDILYNPQLPRIPNRTRFGQLYNQETSPGSPESLVLPEPEQDPMLPPPTEFNFQQIAENISLGKAFDIDILQYTQHNELEINEYRYIVENRNNVYYIQGIFHEQVIEHNIGNTVYLVNIYSVIGLGVDFYFEIISEMQRLLPGQIEIDIVAPRRNLEVQRRSQELFNQYMNEVNRVSGNTIKVNNQTYIANYFDNPDEEDEQIIERIYNGDSIYTQAYMNTVKMTPRNFDQATSFMSLYVDRAIELIMNNKSIPSYLFYNPTYFRRLLAMQLLQAFNLKLNPSYQYDVNINTTLRSRGGNYYGKQYLHWRKQSLAMAIHNSGIVELKPGIALQSNNVNENEPSTQTIMYYKNHHDTPIISMQRGKENRFIRSMDNITHVPLKSIGIDREGSIPIQLYNREVRKKQLVGNITELYEFTCRRLFRSYLFIDWTDFINRGLADTSIMNSFYRLSMTSTAGTATSGPINLNANINEIQQHFQNIINTSQQQGTNLRDWINQRPVSNY